jgi:DNA-binding response OmpR family regulator
VANKGTRDVLLVEDDAGDAGLVRIAMQRSGHHTRLHHVKDGGGALAFLRRIGEYREAPRPDLVLLDLNLPGRTGHEVLEEIKADGMLRAIPVVILSTSAADRDVSAGFAAGAGGYIVKPMDIEGLTATVKAIEDYWFGVVQLPR